MPAHEKSTTLFDGDFLRKLEYLNIVSNRLIPGHLKGQHRARKKGSGVMTPETSTGGRTSARTSFCYECSRRKRTSPSTFSSTRADR